MNGQWGWLVAGLELDFNWIDGRDGLRGSETGNFHFDGEFHESVVTPKWMQHWATRTGSVGTRYNGSVSFRDDDDDNWLSTVRGRLGFTPWERLLIYGTAGVAFQGSGDITATTTLSRTDCAPGIAYKDNNNFGLTSSQNGRRGREARCVTTEDNYGTLVSRGRNQVGWAAGVGLEWAFLDNWSLGIEYLHADLGSYDIAFVDPVATAGGDRRQNRLLAGDGRGHGGGNPCNMGSGLLPCQTSARGSRGGGEDIGPQAAPSAVTDRIRIKDSIDMVRVKLNLRFDTASILGIR